MQAEAVLPHFILVLLRNPLKIQKPPLAPGNYKTRLLANVANVIVCHLLRVMNVTRIHRPFHPLQRQVEPRTCPSSDVSPEPHPEMNSRTTTDPCGGPGPQPLLSSSNQPSFLDPQLSLQEPANHGRSPLGQEGSLGQADGTTSTCSLHMEGKALSTMGSPHSPAPTLTTLTLPSILVPGMCWALPHRPVCILSPQLRIFSP